MDQRWIADVLRRLFTDPSPRWWTDFARAFGKDVADRVNAERQGNGLPRIQLGVGRRSGV